MTLPPPLLELKSLNLSLPDRSAPRRFGPLPKRPILRDIDLSVPRGRCVGLVGESGSGKTTLGRTILRLYAPDSGQLRFDGQDLAGLSEAALRPLRARMQMIFQDPLSSLNPRRRIGDIVVQPLQAYGRLGRGAAARRQACDLLAQVSLPAEFADRYPHQLSGGQRQRVGIARAIALQPDLIVADEIVSGLDMSTQARILLLLRDLRQRLGLTMIFVSHDLSVVRVLCDHVAVMRDGRIVEAGDTAQVFERPRHEYTRTLLEAIPLPEVGARRVWVGPRAVASTSTPSVATGTDAGTDSSATPAPSALSPTSERKPE